MHHQFTPLLPIQQKFVHHQATEKEKTAKMAPIDIKSILISESVDPCCKKILEENGIQVTEKPNMTKDDLMAELMVKFYSVSQNDCIHTRTFFFHKSMRDMHAHDLQLVFFFVFVFNTNNSCFKDK